MSVIGSGNHNGVYGFTHLIKHLPPVFKTLRFWVIAKRLRCIFPVYITQCHDVLCFHIFQVTAPYTANADSSDVYFIAGSQMAV
ncbi:hypothetical protein SDC9_205226 [bioreactor metagenome]|uniref:Uncharacterized protein n=1 Tax=bioreactor metagenome TaxID=1076179 RepID=A0A645J344_9ZZZZ